MTDEPILPVSVDVLTADGNTVTFPEGSTFPPLRARFYDATGDPISFDDVVRVSLRVLDASGDVVIDRGVEYDGDESTVEHRWQDYDLDVGEYTARFVLDYADGGTLKCPSRRALRVVCVPEDGR